MGVRRVVVDSLPRWARLVLGVMAASVVVGVVLALSRPDSPWCDDEGDVACPAEVRYDDRMYVVHCVGLVAATHGDDLSVIYHGGGKDIERRAWTVDGAVPRGVVEVGL